jgi:CRP/FNR family transcriptional regulator, anaerobic regulatory protein
MRAACRVSWTLEPQMNTHAARSKALELYPVFGAIPEAAFDQTLAQAISATVPAGALVFDERSACQGFPMLLAGKIKVVKAAANGRELQLYRVTPGESCIITSSCLLGNSPYSARGVAETELQLLIIPPPVFQKLLQTQEPFREYVFGLFSERLAEMMELVEEVAFHKLDQRLAALLLSRGRVVQVTHQSLADDLGSVREMISRLLKNFAEQGLVALGREQIEILDAARLRRLADPSA